MAYMLHISITIIQNLLITTNSAPNSPTSVHGKLGMKKNVSFDERISFVDAAHKPARIGAIGLASFQ